MNTLLCSLFAVLPLAVLVAGCAPQASPSGGGESIESATDALDESVVAVAGSVAEHPCAIDAAGVVLCRGLNRGGECGVRVGITASKTPLLLRLT